MSGRGFSFLSVFKFWNEICSASCIFIFRRNRDNCLRTLKKIPTVECRKERIPDFATAWKQRKGICARTNEPWFLPFWMIITTHGVRCFLRNTKNFPYADEHLRICEINPEKCRIYFRNGENMLCQSKKAMRMRRRPARGEEGWGRHVREVGIFDKEIGRRTKAIFEFTTKAPNDYALSFR